MYVQREQEKIDNSTLTKHEMTIKDAHIVAYEKGQGMPVLFLHGSPDSHDMWLPLMAYLADDVRSIALDLPGFGQSTLPQHFQLTLGNMADFIHDLLISLKISEPITLVTSDFGGHYGLAFAVKYPDFVRGIAISNTNFFTDYQWHFFAKLYRMPLIGELLLATATRSTMRKTLKGVSPAMPDSYIETSYDSGFGSASVRKTMLRMYRERDSKDFADWEDKFIALTDKKPVIVLWGDKDPFITPSYAERFGKAEVHHFEDYSHWLPLEAPSHYANVLLPWLKQL